MNIARTFKGNSKRPKYAFNQINSENQIHMAFGVLGLMERSRIDTQSRKRVLPSSLDSLSLFNAKLLSIKRSLEMALDSLTLRMCTIILFNPKLSL